MATQEKTCKRGFSIRKTKSRNIFFMLTSGAHCQPDAGDYIRAARIVKVFLACYFFQNSPNIRNILTASLLQINKCNLAKLRNSLKLLFF